MCPLRLEARIPLFLATSLMEMPLSNSSMAHLSCASLQFSFFFFLKFCLLLDGSFDSCAGGGFGPPADHDDRPPHPKFRPLPRRRPTSLDVAASPAHLASSHRSCGCTLPSSDRCRWALPLVRPLLAGPSECRICPCVPASSGAVWMPCLVEQPTTSSARRKVLLPR